MTCAPLRIPSYTVAAADGAAGQYALVLTNGSENRLCIAEREAGGDYALTIDNPTALRQGEDIPELLIDAAGDALFYTYHGGEDGQYEYAEYTYHAVKQNGAWGTVDMTMRYSHEELAAWVQDGKLCRSVSRFDKEDNLFLQNIYLPMPLAGLDNQLTLADFDISLLPTSEYANPPEAMIRAGAEPARGRGAGAHAAWPVSVCRVLCAGWHAPCRCMQL